MSVTKPRSVISRSAGLALLAGLLAFPVSPASAGGKEADGPNAPSADNPGSALAPPPEPLGRTQTLDALFQSLAKAATPAEAAPIKSRIRELWLASDSPTIDLLLARDAEAAVVHDMALRRRLLEAVTHLAPDAPEGWNRRADLDYSERHFNAAMADLGHVLTAEPRQFDALESLANLLKEIGRNELALKAFRRLQTLDPTSANIQAEIDDLARKVEGQKI